MLDYNALRNVVADYWVHLLDAYIKKSGFKPQLYSPFSSEIYCRAWVLNTQNIIAYIADHEFLRIDLDNLHQLPNPFRLKTDIPNSVILRMVQLSDTPLVLYSFCQAGPQGFCLSDISTQQSYVPLLIDEKDEDFWFNKEEDSFCIVTRSRFIDTI